MKNYPADYNWEWYLIAPGGHQIHIKFESFELEQSEPCQKDYLEIREAYFEDPNNPIEIQGVYGAVLARPMRGTDLPREVHSAGNMVWVHFQSDRNATTTYKGSRLLLHQVSTALRCCMTERIAKRGRNTPLSRSRHFEFETRLEWHQNCRQDGE